MIRRHLSRLACEQRGVATIEFALLSVLFFFVMTAGLDIGMWYQQRQRLDSAVEQGGMVAFNQRTSVDTAAISSFVSSAAKLSNAPTITIGCNGGTNNCVNSSRICACVSTVAGVNVYTPAISCNASCADGSLSGYYLNLKAVATSNTMLVPAAMLGGSMTQTRNTVVRLQ